MFTFSLVRVQQRTNRARYITCYDTSHIPTMYIQRTNQTNEKVHSIVKLMANQPTTQCYEINDMYTMEFSEKN